VRKNQPMGGKKIHALGRKKGGKNPTTKKWKERIPYNYRTPQGEIKKKGALFLLQKKEGGGQAPFPI